MYLTVDTMHPERTTTKRKDSYWPESSLHLVGVGGGDFFYLNSVVRVNPCGVMLLAESGGMQTHNLNQCELANLSDAVFRFSSLCLCFSSYS